MYQRLLWVNTSHFMFSLSAKGVFRYGNATGHTSVAHTHTPFLHIASNTDTKRNNHLHTFRALAARKGVCVQGLWMYM